MLKKKIFTICLAMMMVVTMGIPTNVFAKDINTSAKAVLELKTEEDLRVFSEKLKHMSESELQEVIDYAKVASEEKMMFPILEAKAAWLAAAQIARSKGYPLSATLVEHSVFNNDYSETNGNFASAIKATNVYKRMIEKVKDSDAFEKSDNKDLFYSIHAFSYSSSGGSQGVRIRVHDTFDFKLDTSYESLFTSIVNNWAFLNQNLGVLNPIEVNIDIDV